MIQVFQDYFNLNASLGSLGDLCMDSRKIKPGDVFVALTGQTMDGHQFILDAIQNGASCVLAEKQVAISQAPIIVRPQLKNELKDILKLFYPKAYEPKLVGITGTNGKTTCTHLIMQLLHTLGTACGVMGTLGLYYNNKLLEPGHLTTPDSCTLYRQLAKLSQQGAAVVALEISSHALSQLRLQDLVVETTAFTNLSQDHLDYHTDLEDYFSQKAKLFEDYQSKYRLFDLDTPYGQRLFDAYKDKPGVFGISLRPQTSLSMVCYVEQIIRGAHATQVFIHTPWGKGTFETSLIGDFNLSNILIAVCVAALQGYALPDILSKLVNLFPVTGRMMRLVREVNWPQVVIDYAHTPDALEKALKALRPAVQGKLWCVFGCGGNRDRSKRPEMLVSSQSNSDYVIITEDNPRMEDSRQIFEDMLQGKLDIDNVLQISDRAKAIEYAIMHAQADDWILVAGKGHETYQEIGNCHIPFSDIQVANDILAKRKHNETVKAE